MLHRIAFNTILWSKLYPFGCIGKHFCADYTPTGIFYFSSNILSSSRFKDLSHSSFCLRITSYFMLPCGQHDNRKLKSFSLLRILSFGSQTSNFGSYNHYINIESTSNYTPSNFALPHVCNIFDDKVELTIGAYTFGTLPT